MPRRITLLFAAALTLGPLEATAGVSVPTPAGWSSDANASREALAEAEAWASATGLEVHQVASPNEDDTFIENLAVLVDRRPLQPELLEDEAGALSALTELANQLFDASADPTFSGFFDAGETTAMRARWEVDQTIWDLILAPCGSEHALVVLKTKSANRSFHGNLVADVVAGIEGVEAPTSVFPQATWRWSLLGGWLVIAVAAHLLALRRSNQADDHLLVSRKTSIALILLAVVGAGITFAVFRDRDAVLALAELSAQGLALEMLGMGVLAGLASMLVGRLLRSGPQRVESAPKTGVFSAEVGATPAAPLAENATPNNPVPRPVGPSGDADIGSLPRK